ncbi:MAG: hypothetical protein AB7G62_16615 [Magnetospirillum sp.]
MSGDDVERYLRSDHASTIFRNIGFWNGNRVRGELETLATNFALGLYDALHKAAVQHHGECPPQLKRPEHPGLTVTYTPPQNDIVAWRKTVGAELTAGMAEGRNALRDKCLSQIAQRPWLKTFAPFMSEDCVAVDRHGVGLFLYASFDLARPSIAVRHIKEPGLNLDELAQALARRPRAKRR